MRGRGGGRSMHTASHVSHRVSQLPEILNAHADGKVPIYYITKRDSVHVGPLKVVRILLISRVREPD